MARELGENRNPDIFHLGNACRGKLHEVETCMISQAHGVHALGDLSDILYYWKQIVFSLAIAFNLHCVTVLYPFSIPTIAQKE